LSVEELLESVGAGASGMKAKTMAKPLKNPINLSKDPVRFTPIGSIETVVQPGRAHPGVEGRLAGEARMTRNPPHAGEMHPDGDELLYLVEGAVDIVLDEETGERCLSLQPGQALCCAMRSVAPGNGQGTVLPIVFYARPEPRPVETINTPENVELRQHPKLQEEN
jgi:hypothetical protein